MIKKLVSLLLIIFIFTFTGKAFAEIYPIYVATISSQSATQPSGVVVSPDGTKISISRFGSGTSIFQYTLNTPFSISSLDTTSEVELNLNAGDDDIVSGDLEGHTFNGDGTKIYAIDLSGNMNVHSLSTPYDLSNVTQDADDTREWKSYLLESNIRPHDLRFSSDGTKMYSVDANVTANTSVVQWNLATPYDPDSATDTQLFNIRSEINTVTQDIDFDDDGTRMYVAIANGSSLNHRLVVYKLSTPFDVTSATHAGTWETSSGAHSYARPLGMHFGKDGMKLYLTEWLDHEIHEYDLPCPYGIIVCETVETNIQTQTTAQIDFARNVIKHNTSTIFRRFDWLRRNENNLNLYSHDINFNLKPMIGFLPEKIKSPLADKLIKKVNSLNKNFNPNEKTGKWSFWSHGDVTLGEKDNSNNVNPREFLTTGLTIGADRKYSDNFFGFALRYGNEDIDFLKTNANELDTEAVSLNFYNSTKLNDYINLNVLIGGSTLEIDKLEQKINTGTRDGEQIYSALSLQARKGLTDFNLMPTFKIDLGITELFEYNQLHTSQQLVAHHDNITFESGTITTGLQFDNLKDIIDGKRSINGSFEYVNDFTSDLGYEFRNAGDAVYQTRTYSTNSIHNFRSSIGYERILDKGYTFGFNYENFQSFETNTVDEHSFYLKVSHVRDDNKKTNLDFDPINDNLALKYNLDLNGINLSLNSNHSLKDQEDFDAMVKFSNKF